MNTSTYWRLAWGRLALNASLTNRGLGTRPRRDWSKVEKYAEDRRDKADLRLCGWMPISTAPKDGEEIEMRYRDAESVYVVWSQRPVCMLGSRCGGYPPGWATPVGGDTDANLPVDAGTHWRPKEISAPANCIETDTEEMP